MKDPAALTNGDIIVLLNLMESAKKKSEISKSPTTRKIYRGQVNAISKALSRLEHLESIHAAE